MAVNTMGVENAYTLLNAVHSQVTGKAVLASIDSTNFVSVAQETLRSGYEPVLNALAQQWTRTIFAERPYNRKFAGLRMDEQRYGAVTRKISFKDKDWQTDPRYSLTDGQSVDHYVVNKPQPIETKFYGSQIFYRDISIFKDQLDLAFSNPAELAMFNESNLLNINNQIEQTMEETARITIANFVTGKVLENETTGIIHALTEYNTATGLTLTATTVMQPANFKAFCQWLYGRVADLSDMMEQRSNLFQFNTTAMGQLVNRHTPKAFQKIYLSSNYKHDFDARAVADTFHDSYLRTADVESIPYWQQPAARNTIKAKPVYMAAGGGYTNATADQTVEPLIGIMFDRDAMGYVVKNEWSAVTPLNVKGGYWNMGWHYTHQYFNDFTEKFIMILLD